MNKAILKFHDKTIKLDVLTGSTGPDVIDISPLLKENIFTLDPGFTVTASCQSNITYIDGQAGVLLHRGYAIAELAEHKTYLEVAELLLHGELPTKKEAQEFAQAVVQIGDIPQETQKIIKAYSPNTHPMAMLMGAISTLSSTHTPKECHKNLYKKLLQYMAIIGAYSYRHINNLDFIHPNKNLSYSENFLYMLLGKKSHQDLVHAMDLIFMLHADHEQNASTSAVRVSGSTGTDPFSSIIAGVTALWGPLHGGANEAVIKMLEQIGDVSKIDDCIKRAQDKSDPFRLMGFGHRVYKNFDPRSKVMKEVCDKVLHIQQNSPLLEIAKKLEEKALAEDYFKERNLYPNIDFYSGIIMHSIGIPTSLFTVIFAIGRTSGWFSHWNEMKSNQEKLSRPRQLYKGYKARKIIS